VECRRSERLDAAFPASWGAEVHLRLRGGETITRRVAEAPGSPARPLSEERLLAKAAGLAGADTAAVMAGACAGARDDDPVRELIATLSAEWSDIGESK
jgi:2-methylcitrate dehydratase PrpD